MAQVFALVLGIMQDGGLPHIGCYCRHCLAAQRDSSLAEPAAALAIVDRRGQPAGVWLIDATPDIGRQLQLLAAYLGPHPDRAERLRQPDGLFLTHGHMGHTAGLPQLGPEALMARELPVYALPALLELLARMPLWQPLWDGLRPVPLAAGTPLVLRQGLSLTPLLVPHRDEIAGGTVAFLVAGPQRRLLYVPDIDDWAAWPEGRSILRTVDLALVDGSFFSRDELGGRAPVAHPLVPETLAFAASLGPVLLLTHINHTNPILDPDSPQRRHVEASGARLARTGEILPL